MSETLLDHPVANYHKASLRKPGTTYEAGNILPKMPNINLFALRVQMMLENDIETGTKQLESLPQKAQRFAKRGAGLAIRTYLASKAIPMPGLAQDIENI